MEAHGEFSKTNSLVGKANFSLSDYGLLVHVLLCDRYFEGKRIEWDVMEEGVKLSSAKHCTHSKNKNALLAIAVTSKTLMSLNGDKNEALADEEDIQTLPASILRQ